MRIFLPIKDLSKDFLIASLNGMNFSLENCGITAKEDSPQRSRPRRPQAILEPPDGFLCSVNGSVCCIPVSTQSQSYLKRAFKPEFWVEALDIGLKPTSILVIQLV